ncbi:MAG: metal-dependent transcriptional regulator [Planctomycetota bacterium]
MTDKESQLTGALEDYLETIFELVRDQKFARVKDIARVRGVKAGSVSPAMRRLADMGFIKYIEREYIGLTPEGEAQARCIYAKHQLLTRFFSKILKMPSHAAEADACAIEHSLSAEGMDHLTRFFEFLQGCPEGEQLLEKFLQCSLVHSDVEKCKVQCNREQDSTYAHGKERISLWELKAGDQAQVCRTLTTAALRQNLLEKGLVPDAVIGLERFLPDDEQVQITLHGFSLTLEREEAESVIVTKV